MDSILEDFYFGALDPCAHIDTARAASAQADLLEERLGQRLSPSDQKLLFQLLNAHAEENGTIAVNNFIAGFRLGVRLIAAAYAQ